MITNDPFDPFRVRVRVWGDMACFTAPWAKVERYSYEVPTASAARGMVEAIYWHPQFAWMVEQIRILSPIRYAEATLRNEVKHPMSLVRAEQQLQGIGPLYFVEDDRTRRFTVPLINVNYVIVARAIVRSPGEDLRKHVDIFNKRVSTGACHHQPYFGIREYWAAFGPATGEEPAINESRRLGPMLFDLSFDPDQPGRGTPIFSDDVRLEKGVIHVPVSLYRQVHGYELAFAQASPESALSVSMAAPSAQQEYRGEGAHGNALCRRRDQASSPGAPSSYRAPEVRDLPADFLSAHQVSRYSSTRHAAFRRSSSPVGSPRYKERGELLAIARKKLKEADPTVRFIWYRFYLYLQSNPDMSQAATWVRELTRMRSSQERLTPRASAVYADILAQVGVE